VDCADEDTLAAMIAGALTEQQRAAIAIHAASCESCHALIDGLVATDMGSDTTPMKLVAGDRVGRYEIDSRLGAGGMGVVYAAIDTELQRKVALKLMRPDGLGQIGTQGRERMMREARLLAALSHPNVVTVFDVGTHDSKVFVAMELVDGGSLASWLARETRTTNEIVDRMIEAGRGLAAAHARGVVHRDVKPDNILVGLDGHARVTDFGLARIGDSADPVATRVATLSPDLTATGALMGTPVYMAPEQWSTGSAEPRTDQWAFCATLYELVAGVRPFSSDNAETRRSEVEAGRLAPQRPDRDVPAWLRKIIVRGLRAAPADRWDSMDVVVAALVRGRHRRRRLVQTGTIVAAVAIVAISVGIAVTRTPAAPAVPAPVGMAWEDVRPGCSCPFSTCDEGTCTSVCKASDFDFVHRHRIPELDVSGDQEALAGVSGDGNTILYLTGKICALDRLMVAHRRGDRYVATDLTPQLDRSRHEIVEGCCTLANDGTSVIVRWRDHHGFDRIALANTTLGAIDKDEFANIRPRSEPTIDVGFPVVSKDGLRMYLNVYDTTDAKNEIGPITGNYVATRIDRTRPFPPSVRIAGYARNGLGHFTAESSDGRTLFGDTDYGTGVLIRATLDGRFERTMETTSMPRIAGFRTVPVDDCSRVFTTYTPGGCRGEEIVWFDAVSYPPKLPLSTSSASR